MKLLAFTPFTDGVHEGEIHINPEHVVSVLEKELWSTSGSYQKVAVIHLVTGGKHIVDDHNRTVAQQLMKE